MVQAFASFIPAGRPAGHLPCKPLVWNVKVEIKAGDNSVTLDRHNGTKAEK
jgi:hypothetical protein